MLLTRRRAALAFPDLADLSWFPFVEPVIRIEEYHKDDRYVVRAELPGVDPAKDIEVTAKSDIPIGHKVALRDYKPGDTVIKYGVDIGKVVAPIKQGEHLHVHNVKTKRW